MKEKPFISLKVKMSIGLVIVCFLIGLLAVLLANKIAKDIVEKEYINRSEHIAEAVAISVNTDEVKELTDDVMTIYKGVDDVVPSIEWGSDRWNEYMSNYDGIDKNPIFDDLKKQLRAYQDIFEVNCIYIMQFNKEAGHAVYIIDAAYEDICPPGAVDSFEDGIWPDESGIKVPAAITNEEIYGWLVTAGHAIVIDGEIVSYLCVDISMNEIKAIEHGYVLGTTIVMISATLLILAIALTYVSKRLVEPVVLLSNTAKNYCSENNEVVHHAFENLTISSNDEISQLLVSMKQMEKDMNANINTLIDTKVALKKTEEKATTMETLAAKDTLTGVYNRLAYEDEIHKLDNEISEGFNKFGIAMIDLNDLKKINDSYGHANGNIAIKSLSDLTCDVFKHSQVFRIGGDEFVVIVKNKDLKNIDTRIEDFNDQIMELQNDSSLNPWERIGAALGFTKFDKYVDKTASDVFKRADKAMYARKAAMKAR